MKIKISWEIDFRVRKKMNGGRNGDWNGEEEGLGGNKERREGRMEG